MTKFVVIVMCAGIEFTSEPFKRLENAQRCMMEFKARNPGAVVIVKEVQVKEV